MTKGHSGSAWFGDYGLKRSILMRAGRLCAASAVGLRRKSARFGRANAIDHSVIAITSAEVLCRHTARRAGNSRAEVMIIATGAKAPETPARTVMGWFTPPSALRRGADGSVTILPPSGWAICDGTKGTSDLSNRFIIDGSRNEGIGSSAGSGTHSDDNASVPPAGTWRAGGELASAGHDRGGKTDPSESISASVTLIYIMKL